MDLAGVHVEKSVHSSVDTILRQLTLVHQTVVLPDVGLRQHVLHQVQLPIPSPSCPVDSLEPETCHHIRSGDVVLVTHCDALTDHGRPHTVGLYKQQILKEENLKTTTLTTDSGTTTPTCSD